MDLLFLGAAREVTGSAFLLTAGGQHVLIDCGMEQGYDTYENQRLPVKPSQVDCVVLTHAHIDHSGMIPALVKQGFSGPIYATRATIELCSIMLLDSAHIQENEAEWRNRKSKRAGRAEYVPLYTQQDALDAAGADARGQLYRAYRYFAGLPPDDDRRRAPAGWPAQRWK